MYTVKEIQEYSCDALIGGKWVPARPLNHKVRSIRQKIREAWMVFTGKADALLWPRGQ